MESPREEARECPAGAHRSRRTAAAALAVGPGPPPPRAQMASSHLSLSGTCPRQHLLQEGDKAPPALPGPGPLPGPVWGAVCPILFFFLLHPYPVGQSLTREGTQGMSLGQGGGLFLSFDTWGRTNVISLNCRPCAVLVLWGRPVTMLGAGGRVAPAPDPCLDCLGFVA